MLTPSPECTDPATTATERRRQCVASEPRLVKWELEHGFAGVFGGTQIHRACACGRQTSRLSEPQCGHCKGVVRVNQRFECRMDGCGRAARKAEGMLCRPCWVAEDPERAERVLQAWEKKRGFAGVFYGAHIARKCDCGKPLRSLHDEACATCAHQEAKRASGFTPLGNPLTGKRVPLRADGKRNRKTCSVDGCGKGAYFKKGTLCESCYVKADPVARGCMRCQRHKRLLSREDGLCWVCARHDAREGCCRRSARAAPVNRAELVDEFLRGEDLGTGVEEELRACLHDDGGGGGDGDGNGGGDACGELACTVVD